MFEILGGKPCFWQWDLNQQLIIKDAAINEIHFCNRTEENSLVCEVKEQDGLRVVDVPNKLLQTAFDICVYAVNEDSTRTEARYKVKKRTKPADYVYTETEVKNYDDLEKRITNLELGGGAGIDLTNYYTKEETNAAIDENSYDLPTASETQKGGVKIGNGLQMDGETLEVVPNDVYELIESITLDEDADIVVRTAEPDGTALQLTHLMLTIMPPTNYSEARRLYINVGNTDNTGVWNANDRIAYLTHNDIINTSSRMTQVIIEKERGVYRDRIIPANAYNATNLLACLPMTNEGYIKAIRIFAYGNTTNLIPAGTTIEIWGVRANA